MSPKDEPVDMIQTCARASARVCAAKQYILSQSIRLTYIRPLPFFSLSHYLIIANVMNSCLKCLRHIKIESLPKSPLPRLLPQVQNQTVGEGAP